MALLAVPCARAGDDPGRRVSVAVFGDSTAEAYHLARPLRDGLVPRLAAALERRGYERGATGLIPAMPTRFDFNAVGPPDSSRPAPGGWQAVGFGAGAGVVGPSGYGAYTTSPGATATAPVDGTQLQVLYEAGPAAAPFSVTAGAASWPIDPSAQPDGPASTWLELPPGTESVTVDGPAEPGPLAFDGLVVHRPPAPGRVQVEVSNLAHGGHQPGADLGPRIVQAIQAQAYDLTVLLYGPIAELTADPRSRHPVPASYVRALRARARVAHATGGSCLVADAYPLRVPRHVAARFAAAHRRVARTAGCAYSGALRGLWRARTAHRRRLVILDDVHPTARGYRRIAAALAPAVARIVARRAAATSAAAAR